MLDESKVEGGGGTSASGTEYRAATGVPSAEAARWICVTEMCKAVGMPLSAATRAAWMSLHRTASDGGMPRIGGRPVRMAVQLVGRHRVPCLHPADAQAVQGFFPAFVKPFEMELESRYGRYDPEEHADWLSRGDVFEILKDSTSFEALVSMWTYLRHEARDGRESRIGTEALRTRLLAHHAGRLRMHIHRDDVHLLDWRRYRADRKFLSLRQVVDHFHDGDTWSGFVAEKLMRNVSNGFEQTGHFTLHGVRLGQVRVPTPEGIQMRMPAASLPRVGRIVRQVCESLVDRDLERAPPDDADLGSLVDCRELGPATMTMLPM